MIHHSCWYIMIHIEYIMYIYIYLLYINIYIYIIYKYIYIYIYRLYNIIYTVGSFLKLGYPQIMEFNRIYTIFWYWKPWWRLGIQNGLPSHGREAKRGSGQPFDPPELASVSLEISLECSGILFFFKSCSCHVLHSKKKIWCFNCRWFQHISNKDFCVFLVRLLGSRMFFKGS